MELKYIAKYFSSAKNREKLSTNDFDFIGVVINDDKTHLTFNFRRDFYVTIEYAPNGSKKVNGVICKDSEVFNQVLYELKKEALRRKEEEEREEEEFNEISNYLRKTFVGGRTL